MESALMSSVRSQVLEDLAQRIQEIETSCHSRRQPRLSFGLAALDELLPEGRLPAGSLVELFSAAGGAGAWTLALLLAKQTCGQWEGLGGVAGQTCLSPPAGPQ